MDEQEQLALIDDAFPIQIQCGDGGAANRREADDEGEIFIPGEMFRPSMAARVKQGNQRLRERVERVRFVVLEIVTALAGAREVAGSALATRRTWDNVFVGETIRAVAFLTDAVFTTALRPFHHELMQLFRDAPFSHAKPAESPIGPSLHRV